MCWITPYDILIWIFGSAFCVNNDNLPSFSPNFNHTGSWCSGPELRAKFIFSSNSDKNYYNFLPNYLNEFLVILSSASCFFSRNQYHSFIPLFVTASLPEHSWAQSWTRTQTGKQFFCFENMHSVFMKMSSFSPQSSSRDNLAPQWRAHGPTLHCKRKGLTGGN